MALATASATGYAAVTLGSRRVRERLPVLPYTGLTFAVGALLLAPAAITSGATMPVDPGAWLLLVYLGLAPSALAYALFFTGLRTTTATAAAVATLTEPATATVLAAAILGERLTLLGVLGAAVLLASVLVLALPSRSAPAGGRR
jgi:drug/metabolite transporter, DME family